MGKPKASKSNAVQTSIIDNVYRRIHKQYNPQKGTYEIFKAASKQEGKDQSILFNVLYHKASPQMRLEAQVFVELKSQFLVALVTRCMRHVLEVKGSYDYDYDGYEEGILNEYQVDAKKLFGNIDILRDELVRLQTTASDTEEIQCSQKGEHIQESESTELEPASATKLTVQVNELQKLIRCLEREFASTQQRFNELAANDEIAYDLLWYLFPQNQLVTYKDPDSDLTIAGQTIATGYRDNGQMQQFEITVQFIDFNGEFLHHSHTVLRIESFENVRKISLLGTTPLLDGEFKQRLIARGRGFVRLQGVHHLEYNSDLIVKIKNNQLLKFSAAGRAMIDCVSFRRMNLEGQVQQSHQIQKAKLENLTDNQLAICSPTVLGYSFPRKMWGRFAVDQFSPIIWRKDAFDHLILPQDTKDLIYALVCADRKQCGKLITDVIDGKSGGCIIVLHGRPGTGKTLTAEAVAELKQMPLITVSVGELGESAATLEAKLTEILECASLWDAVVLLDEADVFLQARTLHEIQRNAMVGVFLRILEYHQRIMFLTTNRIATFDEAFKSRISVAINYKDLDVNTRRSIWVNFLAMATVKIVDTKPVEDDVAYLTTEQLEKLASKCFNGREIKNAVRTAQALAMSTNKKLNYALLLKVIHIMEEFDQDFATSLYS